MTDDDLVAVANYVDIQAASIAQAQLENHNIKAVITGGQTANTLWYVGTALGGVQLFVVKRDAKKAQEVLALSQTSASFEASAPWRCSQCGVDVEGSFDVCWSCATPRDGQL